MVGYGRGVSGIPFRLGSMNGTPTINVALIPTLKDRYDTHEKGKRGNQDISRIHFPLRDPDGGYSLSLKRCSWMEWGCGGGEYMRATGISSFRDKLS